MRPCPAEWYEGFPALAGTTVRSFHQGDVPYLNRSEIAMHDKPVAAPDNTAVRTALWQTLIQKSCW